MSPANDRPHVRTHEEHAAAVAALLAPLAERLADPARARLVPVQGADGAAGRVLAVDVVAPGPLPSFPNSQMDGYAVRASDLDGAAVDHPVTLPVGRTTAAGDPAASHEPGTASPVMTGGAIPVGADAVVPIEQAVPPVFPGLGPGRHDAPAGAEVAFTASVGPGDFVRETGSDIAAGALLAAAGTRVSPALAGALAGAGLHEVALRPRVRVLLCSTGHELLPPGAPLASGKLHDANTALLGAALRENGADVVERLVPDDADALRAAIVDAAPDLVVTTGGVSAGAFEVVRDALEPAGVAFVKVAMQPGGPQGLGVARLGRASSAAPSALEVPVVAFPGNPVSAAVSFELFLRPWLRRLAGRAPDRPRERRALAHPVSSPEARHQVRRGILLADGTIEVGAPGSHLLHDYARATVLAHLPIGVGSLPAGAEVDVWRIDD